MRLAGNVPRPACALALALLCAACDPVHLVAPASLPTVAPTIAEEPFPDPGTFHVEAEPPRAEIPLTVAFRRVDDEPGSVRDRFGVGDFVAIDRATFPGRYTLMVNGEDCTGAFDILSDQETDLLLQVTEDACATTVEQIHPGEVSVHAEFFAAFSGRAPLGSEIRVAALEDRPGTRFFTASADESGFFRIDRFPPGRYRVEVLSDRRTVATVEVSVRAGESLELDLRAGQPSAPPRQGAASMRQSSRAPRQ